MAMVKKGEVYWGVLDPVIGSEIAKKRPCVIVSPDEMNRYLRTVIVAPLTTTNKTYKSRVTVNIKGKIGQVACDQIRTIDKSRLSKDIYAELNITELTKVSLVLQEMFAL